MGAKKKETPSEESSPQKNAATIEADAATIQLPKLDLESANNNHVVLHIRLLEVIISQAQIAIARGKDHLTTKYADQISSLLAAKDEPYGSVTFPLFEGVDLEYNLPKQVKWDEEKLSSLYTEIKDDWKENPAEYIDAGYSIPEARYKAWPGLLKKKFEDARTVKPGKPALKIKVEGKNNQKKVRNDYLARHH